MEKRKLSKGEQMLIDLGFEEYRHNMDPVPDGDFITQDEPGILWTLKKDKGVFNGWNECEVIELWFGKFANRVETRKVKIIENEKERHVIQVSCELKLEHLDAIKQMLIDINSK